jgi:hypothetical protein
MLRAGTNTDLLRHACGFDKQVSVRIMTSISEDKRGSGAEPPAGSRGRALVGGSGGRSPPEANAFLYKLVYFLLLKPICIIIFVVKIDIYKVMENRNILSKRLIKYYIESGVLYKVP